ncbi:MAG: PorT family protein [Chitinophagales bacterium]|nr:PorT family protein [Chitinophagales bacterium]
MKTTLKIYGGILVLLISFFTTTASAQEISIVGGMNISNMSEKDKEGNYAKEENYKVRVGGHIGFLIGFDLEENIGIQTGLLISTKGYKEKHSSEIFKKIIHKDNITYLELPILMSFKQKINDKIGLYGGLGPVLGIA